jgi:hypothetical protein
VPTAVTNEPPVARDRRELRSTSPLETGRPDAEGGKPGRRPEPCG